MKHSALWLVLSLFSAVALAKDAELVSAQAFSSVQPFPVSGANPRAWTSTLSFGPWHSAKAVQGPTLGFGLKLLGVSLGYSSQAYQLSLTDGKDWQHMECISAAVTGTKDGWTLDLSLGEKPVFACGIQGKVNSTMQLKAKWDNKLEGTSQLSDRVVRINSLHQLKGAAFDSMDPVGYLLSDHQGPLAQVEVINSGKVWIDPSLPGNIQLELAALVAALLLYVPDNSNDDF